jgi:hypothetical protein
MVWLASKAVVALSLYYNFSAILFSEKVTVGAASKVILLDFAHRISNK